MSVRAIIFIFIIAAALIAAHFLRGGHLLPALSCLLLPALFAWRRRWSLLVLQVFAYGAALTWVAIGWELVEERWALGRPWLLTAGIIAAVAALTAVAGALLRSAVMRQRYRD